MVILGLWDGHDAGAALLVDGRVAAAVNEERLSRRKLDVRFPSASIACCLSIAGLAPRDVDVVAASTTDPAKTLGRLMPWTKERYYAVRRRKVRPGVLAGATQFAKQRMTEWRPSAATTALSRSLLRRDLSSLGLGRADLRVFDHHHCHARTAAHASGFDPCVVVTIDGLGDGRSSTVSVFRDGRLELVASSPARDSLGVFFEHVTRLLNMRELEDEGKVMALADYAAPIADDRNPLLDFFSIEKGRMRARVPGHAMARELKRWHWSMANEQFAFIAQRTVERVCGDLVKSAIELTGVHRVALAGGVASNIKANRVIRMLPDVEDVFVFPHMGDGGLALGAALAAADSRDGVRSSDSLALGPEFGRDAIESALQRAGLQPTASDNVSRDVAERIVAGQVICWFQGRMEYGPRALGYRSVLARPDRADLRDRLNLILKRRVWYQPFCPSVLAEEAPRLFNDWTRAGRGNRAMTMAYQVRPDYRQAMSGVTSIDGSCRPQLVDESGGEPLAPVLRRLRALLGVGAVLNTSFNIHGEPLVCSPAEAIDVFQRCGADALAIGPYIVERPDLTLELQAAHAVGAST